MTHRLQVIHKDGSVYLIQELGGEDLMEYIEKARPFSEPEAAQLIRKVTIALHHMHKTGLAHRDIKASSRPPNVASSVT